MKRFTGRPFLSGGLALIAVGLGMSGCNWTQFQGSSNLSGDNAGETKITPGNVSTLTQQFTASDGTTNTVIPQAVNGDILYVSTGSSVEAYSATGTGCSSPDTTPCAPLWTYATGTLISSPPFRDPSTSQSVAVSNGIVYAATTTNLEAFDASGHTNCSGVPTVCHPVWQISGISAIPTVANNTLYLGGGGGIWAYDANDGQFLWSYHAPDSDPDVAAVTVSGGLAYIPVLDGTAYEVVAVDAYGKRGCSAGVCTPLWTYPLQYPPVEYAIVSGTTLIVQTFYEVTSRDFGGSLEAFDANGVTNCTGSPASCQPEWTVGGPAMFPPVAGDGSVLVNPADTGFSAVTPGTGLITWSGAGTPMAIGGSVLYSADVNAGHVYAFDLGCTSACGSPLWTVPGDLVLVANGMVYERTDDTANHPDQIVAYSLP